jgi:hypothetical protein
MQPSGHHQTWDTVAATATTDTMTAQALRDVSSASPGGATRIPVRGEASLVGVVRNTGANIIQYRVMGFPRESSPSTDGVILQVATDVGVGAVVSFDLAAVDWGWIELQAAAKVGGSQGTVSATLSSKPK